MQFTVPFDADHVPAAQIAATDNPVVGHEYPMGHVVHTNERVDDANEPAAQSVYAVRPVELQEEPVGHAVQLASDTPVALE